MKIYTKTGDAGETSLLGGTRVAKDHTRVAAYGDVDETNAAIGLVLAHSEDARLDELLRRVQADLFALGAELADVRTDRQRDAKAAVTNEMVGQLEAEIDARDRELPPLRAFVLPGGNPVGAHLHHARTVCRRAERSAVALAREATVDPLAIVYLNRLSDLLFVLARYDNHLSGRPEVTW
ncbi:MAG: cob(I)yrinic acid a,c-diamide adenosyltransferase [Vicinamibacteria bacterium]